jgi:hypothetical protein
MLLPVHSFINGKKREWMLAGYYFAGFIQSTVWGGEKRDIPLRNGEKW